MQRSAHYSGCRLARGLDVHPYVSAPAVTGPKVQRHDGAVVGPARSAARGPACSSAAHGPARGAARVSPKKPSRSRPVVRPGCPSMVLGETVKDLSSHPSWRASRGNRYGVGASWSLPPPAPVGRQEEFLGVAEVVLLLGTLVAQFTEVNRPRVDL